LGNGLLEAAFILCIARRDTQEANGGWL
jgi:hypothetical protein